MNRKNNPERLNHLRKNYSKENLKCVESSWSYSIDKLIDTVVVGIINYFYTIASMLVFLKGHESYSSFVSSREGRLTKPMAFFVVSFIAQMLMLGVVGFVPLYDSVGIQDEDVKRLFDIYSNMIKNLIKAIPLVLLVYVVSCFLSRVFNFKSSQFRGFVFHSLGFVQVSAFLFCCVYVSYYRTILDFWENVAQLLMAVYVILILVIVPLKCIKHEMGSGDNTPPVKFIFAFLLFFGYLIFVWKYSWQFTKVEFSGLYKYMYIDKSPKAFKVEGGMLQSLNPGKSVAYRLTVKTRGENSKRWILDGMSDKFSVVFDDVFSTGKNSLNVEPSFTELIRIFEIEDKIGVDTVAVVEVNFDISLVCGKEAESFINEWGEHGKGVLRLKVPTIGTGAFNGYVSINYINEKFLTIEELCQTKD